MSASGVELVTLPNPIFAILGVLNESIKNLIKLKIPHGLKKLPSPAGGKFYFGHYWQVGYKPYKKIYRMGKNIYSIQMGQQCWIILMGYEVISNLLKETCRKIRLVTELLSSSKNKPFISGPYNERYKMILPISKKLIEDVKNDREISLVLLKVYFTKEDEGILDELDIDTVASTLTWIAAALANNPQVQYKAHQELDQIIRHSHLSNVSDELNMTYICAIIKKSQRYCGPVYVGVPYYIE
ncbi:cytochrome P450 [Gigaspora rosea]|uniref:Cytochrome P450 n=1 Tax=Gigaspora rosea TaxID=44941 RepID=A0A397VEY9_9GLOM|nr:cytochrome P450 [Gigaspora rosea]